MIRSDDQRERRLRGAQCRDEARSGCQRADHRKTGRLQPAHDAVRIPLGILPEDELGVHADPLRLRGPVECEQRLFRAPEEGRLDEQTEHRE